MTRISSLFFSRHRPHLLAFDYASAEAQSDTFAFLDAGRKTRRFPVAEGNGHLLEGHGILFGNHGDIGIAARAIDQSFNRHLDARRCPDNQPNPNEAPGTRVRFLLSTSN